MGGIVRVYDAEDDCSLVAIISHNHSGVYIAARGCDEAIINMCIDARLFKQFCKAALNELKPFKTKADNYVGKVTVGE